MKRWLGLWLVVLVLGVSFGLWWGHKSSESHRPAPVAAKAAPAETVYVTNLAQRYISDAEIRRDIPGWEHSVNVDFARFWGTEQYRIKLIGRRQAPQGAISAVFQTKGPVQGALAYHWTERGNSPSITVYAGTGAYLGFSNSVAFDHELLEMAADRDTSFLNVGYPSGYYWLEHRNTSLKSQFNSAIGWVNEVADPVEDDSYLWHGVRLSDFVTPAWFNDGVGMRFDYLGLCQQPYWIRPGGYAIFLDPLGYQEILNFRRDHRSDSGFLKADPRG